MLWIGLMSGTSADAIDAALVDIGPTLREIRLLAFKSVELAEGMRKRIHALPQDPVLVRDLVQLDVELGERFADAALTLLSEADVAATDVEGIGSHGQTVGHFPEPEVRGSLQLGAPSVIHARTGIPVVADFRSADLAAGGQGAPLTAFFHHAYFAREDERRAVLNIGGFTNVTYLPGLALHQVIAFDPGPGNALLDRAARWASGGAARFDRDGERAQRGAPDDKVVGELLADPYFAAPPPKSTGHEHFGPDFFERARAGVEKRGGSPDDLLATLLRVTVESVAQAGRFFPEPPQRWLVYGGGVSNPVLLEALRARLDPTPVELTDAHGIPIDALEAISFAVLGWCASRGEVCNVPAATGAERAAVLGVRTPTASTTDHPAPDRSPPAPDSPVARSPGG